MHSLLFNWCRLSFESRALTCPFKQSNPSIWLLLSWHPTHTHLWVRFSVFLKLFVSTVTMMIKAIIIISTVTVPPSDSDYVNRSASLQQFRLIHTRRSRRSRCHEGGHQYQALIRFILRTYWPAGVRLRLTQKQVDRRLRIVTVPRTREEARKNGVETETNKDKSRSCDVAVTCDDVRCFL